MNTKRKSYKEIQGAISRLHEKIISYLMRVKHPKTSREICRATRLERNCVTGRLNELVYDLQQVNEDNPKYDSDTKRTVKTYRINPNAPIMISKQRTNNIQTRIIFK